MKCRWLRYVSLVSALCIAVVCSACASFDHTQSHDPSRNPPVQILPASLIQPGVLTVGVNAKTAPLAGSASKDNHICGIDVDLASALADQMGLKVRLVDIGTDTQDSLEKKRVDVVFGVEQQRASSTKEQTRFWYSDAYIPSGVALFVRDTQRTGERVIAADRAKSVTPSLPSPTSKPKIAAQSSSKSAWAVENVFGDASLVAQHTLQNVFEQLEAGRVSYASCDVLAGLYFSKQNNTAVSLLAFVQKPHGYCMVASTRNTGLQQALSLALKNVKAQGYLHVIQQKWLGCTIDASKIASVALSQSSLQQSSSAQGTLSQSVSGQSVVGQNALAQSTSTQNTSSQSASSQNSSNQNPSSRTSLAQNSSRQGASSNASSAQGSANRTSHATAR